jgi:hypothetical protein
MAITDVDTALSAGIAAVRLRDQFPGETGDALSAVPEQQVRLTAARDATGPLQQVPQPIGQLLAEHLCPVHQGIPFQGASNTVSATEAANGSGTCVVEKTCVVKKRKPHSWQVRFGDSARGRDRFDETRRAHVVGGGVDRLPGQRAALCRLAVARGQAGAGLAAGGAAQQGYREEEPEDRPGGQDQGDHGQFPGAGRLGGPSRVGEQGRTQALRHPLEREDRGHLLDRNGQ